VSTVAAAWDAFLAAIAEAVELHGNNGAAAAVADLLQHAREMLDVIDEESAAGSALPEAARRLLESMRERLASLERALVTVH
jgi:hypothetical protein